MREKKPKTWMMGLKYFEEFVKRNFNEEEHQEINIPFPGLADDEEIGLDSGFLVMTAAQAKDIFEPVVKEVCDLVQGQVDLDSEILKAQKKLDLARMNLEKARKVEAQPDYEKTVPEDVRAANEEKVRVLLLWLLV